MKLIKVVDAQYIGDYKIRFQFNDGKEKIVNFENELWGEIFEPLKDKAFFKNFTLNAFTIEWENGADFAPEYLYYHGEEATQKKSAYFSE